MSFARGAAVALAIALTALCPGARAAEPLALEAKIPLGQISGRIDRLVYESKRGRLIAAELGNNSVAIIDLDQRTLVHRIAGLNTPQGVAYLAATDVIYVASAGDGTVRRFKAGDFTEAARTNLGDDADRIRVDPATSEVVVGYGAGGLAVLNEVAAQRGGAARQSQSRTGGGFTSRSKPGTTAQAKRERSMPGIGLPVHPEGFQLDTKRRRIFVNLPDLDEVGVIDRASGKIAASWRAPGLSANFPMAFDEAGNRVLVVYRRPPRLVVFDADGGSIVGAADVCRDPDDVFVDAKRRRIYVTCGEGVVDVLQQDGSDYRQIGRIASAPGARTGLYVAERDRFYAAAPATETEAAAILVFRPVP